MLFGFAFAVLLFQYTNCGQAFRANSGIETSSSLQSTYGACWDPEKKQQNQIYILGASEYYNIAEDLFPSTDLTELKKVLNILPVVPDPFDGNLELKSHVNFILSREPIIDLFASYLDMLGVGLCRTETSECRKQVLSGALKKIYRRSVSATEIAALVDANMDLSFLSFGKLIFFSPDFHFKFNSPQLSPDDFVAKIAMGLLGTFPDDELIAKKIEVYNNETALKSELIRLLSQPKNARRLSKRLWRQWLSLQKLEFLDLPDNSGIDKIQLLDSIYQRIELAIRSGQSLTQLFFESSNEEIPKSLLTHPAFAMASSRVIAGELKTHYVHRGVNIASTLLCIPIPSLPAATLEEIEESKKKLVGLSRLEAIEQHRSNPRCIACHSIFDPIGVSMERISPFGKYRTTFDDGSPITIQGNFLGQPYKDLPSMIKIVSESEQLRTCFAQNLKGLLDGPEGRKTSDCDAKDVFLGRADLPILDSIVSFLFSPRFKLREAGQP